MPDPEDILEGLNEQQKVAAPRAPRAGRDPGRRRHREDHDDPRDRRSDVKDADVAGYLPSRLARNFLVVVGDHDGNIDLSVRNASLARPAAPNGTEAHCVRAA